MALFGGGGGTCWERDISYELNVELWGPRRWSLEPSSVIGILPRMKEMAHLLPITRGPRSCFRSRVACPADTVAARLVEGHASQATGGRSGQFLKGSDNGGLRKPDRGSVME